MIEHGINLTNPADLFTVLLVTWVGWELITLGTSWPVRKDGTPIRPAVSVVEYLYYNPGVWKGEDE